MTVTKNTVASSCSLEILKKRESMTLRGMWNNRLPFDKSYYYIINLCRVAHTCRILDAWRPQSNNSEREGETEEQEDDWWRRASFLIILTTGFQ